MAAVLSPHAFHERDQLQPILRMMRDTSSTSLASASTSSQHHYTHNTSTTTTASSASSLKVPPIQENEPGTPTRRIRFAPLPDPRRFSLPESIDDEDLAELADQETDNHSKITFEPEAEKEETSTTKKFPCNIERFHSPVAQECGTTPLQAPVPTRTTSSTSSLASTNSSSRAADSTSFTSASSQNSKHPSSQPKPKKKSIFGFSRASSSSKRNSSPAPLARHADRENVGLTHDADDDDADSTSTSDTSTRFPKFTTEEILTLGTINLFRASSNTTFSGNGVPLGRTQSMQSTASAKSRRKKSLGLLPSLFSSSSKSNTAKRNSAADANALSRSVSLGNGTAADKGGLLSTPLSTANVRKGTKMLNGRVYGGRRGHNAPSSNPFANARDEADPAFVEWGYGGMGSVRSAQDSGGVGGSVWGRLQSDESGVFGGTAPNEALTGEKEPPDDGSGMAWIKRRREERAREKEAAEKAAAAAAATTTPPDEAPEEQTITAPAQEATSVTTPTQERPDLPPPTAEEDEEAVKSGTTTPGSGFKTPTMLGTLTPTTSNLSMPGSGLMRSPSSGNKSHFPRSPSLSRATSATAVDEAEEEKEKEHDTRAVNVPVYRRHHHAKDTNVVEEPMSPRSMSDESESDTEDDGDRDDDEDDEDDDDEDDEEEKESSRKTALGAGVEKISRHKEQQQQQEEAL